MIAPKAVPPTRTMGNTTSGCMLYLLINTLQTTPVSAITAPTDKSIPPDKITKVMPTAAIIKNALSLSKLKNTRELPKPSNCTEPIPNNTKNKMQVTARGINLGLSTVNLLVVFLKEVQLT